MKRVGSIFFILVFALSFAFSQSEIEPDNSCFEAIKITSLNGANKHITETIRGTIVSTKYDEVNNKPDYDRDYYYFTPSVSGTVKVNFEATGNMYFWIGSPKCDIWNIRKNFSKTASKTFHVNANERVNFLAMCRWPRSYTAFIEFIPDNANENAGSDESNQNNSNNESENNDSSNFQTGEFDSEPNNICQDSELIEKLDGVSMPVSFEGRGKIKPNQDGERSEGRDYFHFTPGVDGEVSINFSANKNMWFAISNKGCFSPWADSSKWNIQRGITKDVTKTFEVKANQRVDILALSYSNKDYGLKIDFKPKNFTLQKADLQVKIDKDRDSLKVGESVVYDINVSNIGDADAKDVTLDGVVKGDVEIESIQTDGFSCELSGKELKCLANEPLAINDSSFVKIVAKALKEGEIGIDVKAVLRDDEDKNLSNNEASKKIVVKNNKDVDNNATIEALEILISSSNDDAIEGRLIESKGYVYTGEDIDLKEDTLSNDMGILKSDIGKFLIVSAFRFENVDIPKEAKIKNAYIKFISQKDYDKGGAEFSIFAENSAFSKPFKGGDTFDITKREKSSKKIDWKNISTSKEEIFKTPNISPLIKEVINKEDWESGNPLTFIIEPTKRCIESDCHIKAYDFDTDPAKAPVLVIEYEKPKEVKVSKSFDNEPNNDCENASVLTPLNSESEKTVIDFNATIRPNQYGESSEGRDYYTFTASKDGEVKIVLDSSKNMWFAISDKGCFSPWTDSSRWNIQRGISNHIEKDFEVEKGNKIAILALSYSNKDYKVHIEFKSK